MMLDYLRELDPLSRDLRQFQKKRENVVARLTSDFGAQPSEEDIAQEMALPLRRYRTLVQAAQDGVVSLDAASHDDGRPLELMTPAHQVTERRALCSKRTNASTNGGNSN